MNDPTSSFGCASRSVDREDGEVGHVPALNLFAKDSRQAGRLDLVASDVLVGEFIGGEPAPFHHVGDLLVSPACAIGIEMVDSDRVPGPVPALVGMPALIGIEVLLEERLSEIPDHQAGLLTELPNGGLIVALPRIHSPAGRDPARRDGPVLAVLQEQQDAIAAIEDEHPRRRAERRHPVKPLTSPTYLVCSAGIGSTTACATSAANSLTV